VEKDNICYICRNKATSREHVPPLCLFPESKDVLGLNFRKNLITVPSCDEHNSKKSGDDEFLMVSIAGIVGNNFLGYYHTKTKIDRALRRKSKNFLNKAIIRNSKASIIELGKGNKFPVLYGNPDFERLIKCFENIAYGLYFHEHNESFIGNIKMLLGFLKYVDSNDDTMIKFVRRRFELEELALEIKGKNPDIFKYQFCKPDKFGLIALKLSFYKATEVFISFIPIGKSIPFDLGFELMKSGIPTVFTLKDEEFKFNKK
jgi:hypothetical protein